MRGLRWTMFGCACVSDRFRSYVRFGALNNRLKAGCTDSAAPTQLYSLHSTATGTWRRWRQRRWHRVISTSNVRTAVPGSLVGVYRLLSELAAVIGGVF